MKMNERVALLEVKFSEALGEMKGVRAEVKTVKWLLGVLGLLNIIGTHIK